MTKKRQLSILVRSRKATKQIQLNLRVSLTEKQAFEQSARLAGIPLSAWIRERLRNAAMREYDMIGEAVPFLEKGSIAE
jgi:predicted HicB family RNase H-like nuclease